jgi:hypothetical protein
MKSRRVALWAILCGAAIFSGAPNAALACGGEWMPYVYVDERPAAISKAEKALEGGNVVAAAGFVIRAIPHIRSLQAKEDTRVVIRAQRVLAQALARSGGALAVEKEVPDYVQDRWLGKTAEDRQANLEWAVQALDRIQNFRQGDPAIETERAEVMAHLDSRRDEARAILERLAQKDLLASPTGYATLAALREKAGDSAGRTVALNRCRQMSAHPELCSFDNT